LRKNSPFGTKFSDRFVSSEQAQALMRTMGMVMQVIDNPIRLLTPLKKLGVRHLIYGVGRKNFQMFGIALSKTMEAIMGNRVRRHTLIPLAQLWHF
jgi:hemoglobin-like flavoprotein